MLEHVSLPNGVFYQVFSGYGFGVALDYLNARVQMSKTLPSLIKKSFSLFSPSPKFPIFNNEFYRVEYNGKEVKELVIKKGASGLVEDIVLSS